MPLSNRSISVYATLITFAWLHAGGQNTVNLQMEDTSPIVVFLNDSAVNKIPQSNVQLGNLSGDTVRIKIATETGTRYDATLYLLDKGKPIAGKEFNYMVRRDKYRLKLVFMGMYDVR